MGETVKHVEEKRQDRVDDMKIVLASSELSPVAVTGGLGEAVAGLLGQLHAHAHDVCVVLPYYRCVQRYHYWKIKPTGVTLDIRVGARVRQADIMEYRKRGGYQVFFVKCDELFDRDGLYGDGGAAFEDNAERFIFFSKVVVELARRMEPLPDILHCHDWQTSLVPVLVRAGRLPFKTMLTIHNIAYQGQFWSLDFALTNLPAEFFAPTGLEFYGHLNLLKGGILAADMLTVVSDSYAREILTPEGGCGLDGVLRAHRDKLRGILNGVDYLVWNPATDKALPKTYRPAALKGKAVCRAALLEKLGLEPEPEGPVFVMASRLDEAKGFDLLLPIMDRLLADDVRLVIQGDGDPHYHAELTVAARKYAGKLAYLSHAEKKLVHLAMAGSDATLIPSRVEPSGHSAIRALKYGVVPIARDIGGLHEILRDFDPVTGDGWALLFYDYSPEALWDAIVRAKKLYAKPSVWKELVRAGMERNFSWEKSASAYEALYAQLLKW